MIDKGAITIGNIARCGSLAVAPVYASDDFREDVLMLDKAMESKDKFGVKESGSVGKLYIINRLDDKVFIACGALVEGASQNRYSVYPSLIMPHSNVELPVNCAEERQGLLGGHMGRYGRSPTIVMPSIRGGEVSQHDTWNRIMHTTVILNRLNPTRDYSYAEKHTNVDDYIEAVGPPRDGQVGIVAGIRDGERTIFYTDFFGNQKMLGELHPKLAKSFGIVARVHEGNADRVSTDDLVSFLRSIEAASGKRKDHVGGGELYVIESPVKGSILAYEDRTVQVTMRQDWKQN